MLSVILGILCVAFGLFTIVSRIRGTEGFGKNKALENFYGPKAGGIIQIVAFAVIPLLIGVLTLLMHFVWNVDVV